MIQDLENEKWADIPGFVGYYQISNMGRVKSLERTYESRGPKRCREKIRKNTINSNDGYNVCSLAKNGKVVVRIVHRLICDAFIPNPENKPQVNHKNGIRSDNRLENLEWVTAKENQVHSWEVLGRRGANKGKHNNEKMSRPIYCPTLGICFLSIMEARRQLGVDNISAVLNGSRTHAEGLYFRYI